MERQSPLNKHKRRSKYALPLGGVFLVLAVIGLVSVAGFCIRLTNQIMDNTKEKSEFEDYLLPVVMFDPVEFDSPEHAGFIVFITVLFVGYFVEQYRQIHL